MTSFFSLQEDIMLGNIDIPANPIAEDFRKLRLEKFVLSVMLNNIILNNLFFRIKIYIFFENYLIRIEKLIKIHAFIFYISVISIFIKILFESEIS